ncbi:tripartite tricarboxylate transporter substrate-binding protein [Ideonella sp. DXS22W]|uniref:Tripartite tricarboxylate transporter substrate-binding protein n=1 Tax=Pseudaquabacterium inlustre TaxID=2984192 RepID=A0ABU9CNY0_9BURK
MTRVDRRSLLLSATAAAIPGLASAQAGGKPVKILVGYGAGGAVDVIARAIAQRLQADLGLLFIVDNKPGAGSNLAIKATIDAPADGSTLLMAANAVAANMALYQPQPFDAERDLVAISLVGRVPVVIAVNPASPYQTLAQLVAAAKGKPNTINYATPGNGATPHLAVELFTRAAGIDLFHVPYKGGAQAITDVIGGQVPVLAVNALEVLPHARSGKLRVLAVLSASRAATLPDVPTIAESGYPGFEASVWYGLMGPAAMPRDKVAQLHGAVQRALATQDIKDRLAAVGGEVAPATQEAFAAHLKAEHARYERLIRAAKITPD